MNQELPLSVRDFIEKYKTESNLFELLPEFDFIKSIATRVKGQGCYCGLAQEMSLIINQYNSFVENLDSGLVFKVSQIFGVEKVCFVIQTNSSFTSKCYP